MRNILLILAVVLAVSCKSDHALQHIANCDPVPPEAAVKVYDFHRNFSLDLPEHWNINHFYDANKSELFAADTLVDLTDSFILDASFNKGGIAFNDSYFRLIRQEIEDNGWKIVDSGSLVYLGRIGYWHLVEGKKNGFDYTRFNLTLICSENDYFNTFTEIYGSDPKNERLCESLGILTSLTFID
jgi:hypothetical protein